MGSSTCRSRSGKSLGAGLFRSVCWLVRIAPQFRECYLDIMKSAFRLGAYGIVYLSISIGKISRSRIIPICLLVGAHCPAVPRVLLRYNEIGIPTWRVWDRLLVDLGPRAAWEEPVLSGQGTC